MDLCRGWSHNSVWARRTVIFKIFRLKSAAPSRLRAPKSMKKCSVKSRKSWFFIKKCQNFTFRFFVLNCSCSIHTNYLQVLGTIWDRKSALRTLPPPTMIFFKPKSVRICGPKIRQNQKNLNFFSHFVWFLDHRFLRFECGESVRRALFRSQMVPKTCR